MLRSEAMTRRYLSALVFVLIASAAPAAPPLVSVPFDDKKAAELRRAWAKESGLDAEFTNSAGMKLVLIPGGRFEMGPNGSRRAVTLTKPYHLATTELTLGQYRKFKAAHKI